MNPSWCPTVDLPSAFEAAAPIGQAVGLAAMTLLAEDGTTLAAGWMRSMGIVGSATAFWGCFLGIWAGDVLLYGLGRSGHSLLRRLATEERLEAARHWMSRSGILALVACRFLPGTRLPTYLAAGLCRMPLGRFVLATGLLAAGRAARFSTRFLLAGA